jgi:phage terminase small subunit
MPKLSALSPKEELFVAEYLVDKNGTRAFLAAGYSAGNHPSSGAYKLLRKPHIVTAVKKAMQAQMKRTLISADQVLLNLQRIAEKAEGEKLYHPAVMANRLIGQHYKLFTEKHEHGGIGGGPVVLQITKADEDL